jgi:hypothetical protein
MSTVETAEPSSTQALSAYGPARSTVPGTPLDAEEVRKVHA